MSTIGGLYVHDSEIPGLIFYEKVQEELVEEARVQAEVLVEAEEEVEEEEVVVTVPVWVIV